MTVTRTPPGPPVAAPAVSSAPVLPAVLEPVRVVVLAVLTGFVLGIGDLWALRYLPEGTSAWINSCTGWASAVMLLGFALRTHPAYAAVGGAVMMLVAVDSYYVFESWVFSPDLSAWDGLSAQYWAVIGVPTGLLFGILGSWVRLGLTRLLALR